MTSTEARASPGVQRHTETHAPKNTHLLIWFGYVVFVVYGSLVPLDFKPLPFDQAWSAFLQTPMYQLGLASRADWIANGVLYVPVGFLTAHGLLQLSGGRYSTLLLFLAALFSAALAVGVEFTQLAFPPRTVSLNDLLAESIGSLIGLLLAAKYSTWFTTLLHALLSRPQRLVLHLAEAYLLAYVAFSLFPYDILLSAAEIAQKWQSNGWAWLLVGNDHGRLLALLKLAYETFLTLPFGLYLGYRSTRRPATPGQALLLGILLGGSIEIAQFFIASGISQGLSIVSRAAGVYGGLLLWQSRAASSPQKIMAFVQRHAWLSGAVYLLVLLLANGWFTYPWQGPEHALAQWREVHFLPFYYHYFTTEAKALFSLASVGLMYFPIGLLVWSGRHSPGAALCLAALAASLVETGKLFLQGIHPDPTNILLGGLAAWGFVHLAEALTNALGNPPTAEPPSSAASRAPDDRLAASERPTPRRAIHLLVWPLLAFAAYRAATFPAQPAILTLILLASAAVVWCKPVLAIAILPAALPVLDLAQWSGRFYLDEFDLLMAVCLGIAYLRIPAIPAARAAPVTTLRPDLAFAIVGVLLAVSLVVSSMRGLLPWSAVDANTFTHYYSPFNAIRIVKGAVWAGLGYALLKRMFAAGLDPQRPFATGMVAGLALTVAVILWERVTFSGPFNFSSDYRVTGPFSPMHIGGAYIECYLTVAVPFLILFILETRSLLGKISGTALLLATTYALMVTFSRNGYVSFGISLLIVLFFATFRSRRWLQRGLFAAAMTGAVLAVAIPVFTGEFAQKRLATIIEDLAVRQAHWNDALNMRAPGLLTTFFGMGIGRYPESHYLFSAEGNRSGTYQLMTESGNTFLRLVSGDSLYMEQHVSVEPRKRYILKFDARTNRPNAQIAMPICEKWLISSYACIWPSTNIGKQTGTWQHFELPLSSDPLNISHWYSQRPVKLALFNANTQAIVDIDNLRLETAAGDDLIRNGDFSQELDHWFFTTDGHLQWHIKSLPIGVLFDQGWFGVITLALFSLLVIKRGSVRAWHGSLDKAAALAAFVGFLVVGLFDTLIDTPRFLLLFLLLGIFCAKNLLRSR